jgi:hypothetical protein
MSTPINLEIEEPCFVGDEFGPSGDIPTHIMVKTARDTFGVRDDETLHDALVRLEQRAAVDDDKTDRWILKTVPLVHRMSSDESYRKEVAKRLS